MPKSGSTRSSTLGPVVGSRAPDFSLPCTPINGKTNVSLDDYRDRWLVLIFYPRDFSLICPTELTALSARLREFEERECDLLAISTDDVETHARWIAAPRSQGGLGGLDFPLGSDIEGVVSRAYGVLLPKQHVALRGLFVIDPNGVLRYMVVHNLSVGRRSEEVLRVLDGLQTGGLCPENWTPDEPVIDPVKHLREGSMLGTYRVERELGRGAFGAVYQAFDATLSRPVAIKVLRPHEGKFPTDLLDEARAAAAINHPNICTVYTVDGAEGAPMIVMEYLEGRPLLRAIEEGPLESHRAAHIARQLAHGLATAHGQGIVHGDLKPANIMLLADDVAKIMDFGLARRASAPHAVLDTNSWANDQGSSSISGTPAYMAPERLQGAPSSVAGDVFALGLVLHEMLTGRRAIRGRNLLEVIQQAHALDPRALSSETPERFRPLLDRALAKEPSERFTSMEELASHLA